MKEQNKTKKKQKMTAAEILFCLLLLLIGGVCGFFAVQYVDPFSKDGGGMIGLLFFFLSLYLAYILPIFLHEAGHLLFGLLSGYHFVSFRFFSWILVRTEGKLRLRRFSLAGTAGQCLMSPPEMKEGRIPVLLYNLGGVIVNILTAIPALVLFLALPETPILSPFLLFLAIFSLVGALTNGIPLRTGMTDNDGKNAISLGKNPAAMRAFWIQLKVNEGIAKGLRLSEMPDEWFALPEAEEMENPLIATLAVLAENRYMDTNRYTEAKALIDRLLAEENGLIGLHRALLTCDRITLSLLDGEGDHATSLLDATQRNMMRAMKDQPLVMRTEYVLALLHEKDEKKVAAIRAAFEKRARTYPYPNDLLPDRELMEKVDELHAA